MFNMYAWYNQCDNSNLSWKFEKGYSNMSIDVKGESCFDEKFYKSTKCNYFGNDLKVSEYWYPTG